MTDTALVTGTVTLPVLDDKPATVAKRTANNPPSVIPPDDKIAKSQASTAFRENKDGGVKQSTATQRMAYAVLIHAANMVELRLDVPSLGNYFTVPSDGKTIRERMIVDLAGDKPETDNTEKGYEIAAEYKAKSALVVRGCELAAICTKYAVPWSWFDTSMGCMAVRPGMLHPEGTVPLGRLANSERIYLNGKTVLWQGKDAKGSDKFGNANASIAHVFSLNKPPAKPRAGKNADGSKPTVTAGAEFDPKSGASVAKSVDMCIMWQALDLLLAGKLVIANDFDEKSMAACSRVLTVMHESIAAKEWMAKVDGKPAPKSAAKLAKAA